MENENGKETKEASRKSSKAKAKVEETKSEEVLTPKCFQCPVCTNRYGLSGGGLNEICPNCSNFIVAIPVYASV